MKDKITRRYLAGLLDGEGYFGIIKDRYEDGHIKFTPAIKMSLTTPEVLSEIVQKLGGHVHVRYWPNENWKPAYCWESKTYVQVSKVLDYVHEYLIIKKPQADILRRFLNTKTPNAGSTKMLPGTLETRALLYTLLRKLNKRGLPPAETKRESSPKGDEAIVRTP